MHDVEWEVSRNEADTGRLGAELGEYVTLMRALRGLGVLSEVAERLKLARRHGYAGIDVFMFLLAWWIYPEKVGLRDFSYRSAPHGEALAALGDRADWPSQASVSRALATCEAEQVQALSRWLFDEALPQLPLETDVSVTSRCAFGEQWHVFDFDPKVRVFRERALPEGEDLPPPKRRASAMGEPGYPGRKRGERQVSRAALMHAGSGQWVGMWLHPGNGRTRKALSEAAVLAADWGRRRSIPLNRIVLRFDGGACPGIPGVAACRDAGVHWLTRAATHVLKEVEVEQMLTTAVWRSVPDSRSGPRREAAELGTLRMTPSSRTRRSDGSCFEPIEARVVVSRFAAEGKVSGAGLTRGGWHYEAFTTDLPPEHWPAADVVTAYYERAVLENRFAQEDRELQLDRTASCHLPGQQLAVLVGMFAWNLRLWLGAQVEGLPPGRVAAQEPRPPEELVVPPASACEEQAPPVVEPVAATPADTGALGAVGTSRAALTTFLRPLVAQLDWAGLLAHRRDGWRWEPDSARLICPAGQPLELYRVGLAPHRLALLASFRMLERPCPTCPMRAGCIRGRQLERIREFAFVLDGSHHPLIGQLLAALPDQDGRLPEPRPSKPEPPPRWRPAVPVASGPLRCAPPTLIPARLRHHLRELARVEAHVNIDRATTPRPPAAFATSAAQRQRRRWTWRQRHDHNARHPDTRLRVRLIAQPAAAVLNTVVAGLRAAGARV